MKKLLSFLTVTTILFASFAFCFSASAVSGAKTISKSEDFSLGGKVYFEYEAKYAQLTSSSAAAKKVNRYIQKFVKKQFDYHKNFAEIDFTDEHSGGIFPHSLKINIKLVYNQNGKYCFRSEFYEYTGGVHGATIVSGFNFSKKTGKKLSNSQLTKFGKSELKTKIIDKVEKEIQKEPDRFFDEALDTVKDMKIKDFVFWLQGSKLHVFFNNYDLSPYAFGTTEITIKLK